MAERLPGYGQEEPHRRCPSPGRLRMAPWEGKALPCFSEAPRRWGGQIRIQPRGRPSSKLTTTRDPQDGKGGLKSSHWVYSIAQEPQPTTATVVTNTHYPVEHLVEENRQMHPGLPLSQAPGVAPTFLQATLLPLGRSGPHCGRGRGEIGGRDTFLPGVTLSTVDFPKAPSLLNRIKGGGHGLGGDSGWKRTCW